MIITCLKGGTLELSKTRLTEVTGFIRAPYYVRLKEWITKPDTFEIRPTDDYNAFHPAKETQFSIGCRHFSEEVYNQILQAAKLTTREKPIRKTKRKSTKTAKARKKSKRK